MAADKANHNELTGPTCMHSVNRITKLPAVESTFQHASELYGKVKEYNGLTQWTLNSAETTVQTIVEKGKPYANPVLSNLEGPIKTVDDILCSGLDYVETKVPSVKLPPSEIYKSTKEYVTPAMETAYAYAEQAKGIVEPRIQQARDLVDPAYQAALHTVEPMVAAVQPTVEAARHMVDPIVQPTLEKAQQLKDYGKQKVNEYLHRGHSNEGDNFECQECQECQDVNLEDKNQLHVAVDATSESEKTVEPDMETVTTLAASFIEPALAEKTVELDMETVTKLAAPFIEPALARVQQLTEFSNQEACDLVKTNVKTDSVSIVFEPTIKTAEHSSESVVQPTAEEVKKEKYNGDQTLGRDQTRN